MHMSEVSIPEHYTYRVLALVYCGIATLMHSQQQRAAIVFSSSRPNGVVAGLALVAAGLSFEYARMVWSKSAMARAMRAPATPLQCMQVN